MNKLLKKKDAIARNLFVKKNIVNALIEENIALMTAIVLIVKINLLKKKIMFCKIQILIGFINIIKAQKNQKKLIQ